MLNENFVILAAFIIFLGDASYFVDTIQGKIKPNRITWLLWSFAPFVAFAAELKQGVGIQTLIPFAVGFLPLFIFFATFLNKKSYWHIGKLDITCGVLSVLGLILWQITNIGNIAILFSILADALAGAPTVLKAFKSPATESAGTYIAGVISAVITLLTLKTWTFTAAGFTIYYLLICLLLTALIAFKIGKRK